MDMKKILILTSLLFVITLFAHGSDAFYQSYWSDDRNFEVTIPEVFFGSEKGVVTMIVQPEILIFLLLGLGVFSLILHRNK